MAELTRQELLTQSLTDYRNTLPPSVMNINDGFTYTQVTCKDGTVQNQASSPNAQILDACRNNGGRAETFRNVKCNDGSTQSVGSNPEGGRVDMPCKNNGGVSPNQDVQKPRTFIEMNQGYIIIGLVLVAGYFAYKKFKK